MKKSWHNDGSHRVYQEGQAQIIPSLQQRSDWPAVSAGQRCGGHISSCPFWSCPLWKWAVAFPPHSGAARQRRVVSADRWIPHITLPTASAAFSYCPLNCPSMPSAVDLTDCEDMCFHVCRCVWVHVLYLCMFLSVHVNVSAVFHYCR